MSERLTDIPVAPCKLCGSMPTIRSADNHGFDYDEPFCEIVCCNHEGCTDITLTCDCGSDGADCERKAIELWNKLMASCESCKHYGFELPICHKRPNENNVGDGWCCPLYEVGHEFLLL